MKPYGGEGLLARSLRAPRSARSSRLLFPNRINDARMSRLAPRANRSGVAWGGGGAFGPTRGPACESTCGPARESTCKPIRGPTRGSAREKKRTNFVSRISRCTQRTRCPLLIWMPRKRRRSSALKDRSLAMRQELAGRRPASQELAGRGPISWRSPVVGIRGNGNSA